MDMDMDMDVDMVETATMTVPDEDESIAASESAASSRQKKLKRNLAQQRPPVPNELELKKALAELLHNAQNEAAIALDLVSLIISGNPSSSSSSAPSGQSGQQSTVAAALAARRGAPQQAQQHPQPQLPIPAGIIQSSYLVSGGERSSSAALAERAGLMLSTRVHQFDQIAARLSSATTRIKAAVDRDSRMWNELLEIRNRGWLVYAIRERSARFEYKVNYGFLSAGSAHSGNDTALLSRTDSSENKQQNSVSKFQYSAMDSAINAPNDDDDGDKEEEPTGAEAISNKLTQAQHAVFVEELMDQLATSAWTHGTSVPRDASSTHSVTSTSLSLNTSGSVKLDFSTSNLSAEANCVVVNLSAEANCVTNSTEDEEHEDDPWLAQSVLLAAQLRLRNGHRQRIKNRGNHMLPGRTSIPRRIERMVDIVSNDRTASLDSFVTDITRRALVVDAVRDVLHQFANEIERERVQIVHDPTDGSYIAILYAGNSSYYYSEWSDQCDPK
ncbi:hypothetical protein GQ42DRAFT_180802 [Ramicandelaber brevisporus]|nr:hypothetical protein GQ42DRAFT_180802 [Ramicandelaber brevisporus]